MAFTTCQSVLTITNLTTNDVVLTIILRSLTLQYPPIGSILKGGHLYITQDRKSLCTIPSTPQRCISGAFLEIKLKTRCDPGSGFSPLQWATKTCQWSINTHCDRGKARASLFQGFFEHPIHRAITILTGGESPINRWYTVYVFTGCILYWQLGNLQSIADTHYMSGVPFF